ncbi:hypothetical protein [Paenibacillus sp. B01]|uniref:hypothetical protein n=1 Tax=Paenibacillus sp. B01 TaxID=2660554 RepID=UPI00129B148C|nr:hypothetical protein [Paenibacillus sp. B01]QGG57833.1 hypothetical protein GE073_21200 [Paenibacillus sp. B01]
MNEAWDGFGQRMRRLNPFFLLGSGMDLGAALTPYLQGILFRMILEIFYRELNDREDRRRKEIEVIASDVLREMGLTATDQQIARLVGGLLYQGPEQLNKPFESPYFNEVTREWEKTEFRYVTMDELFTDLQSGGSIVYKLTDEAQEMIFMSREISEEFSITIEQLYSIQLIRNGNYKKATRSLDMLLSRVRRLIAEEESFQREVANNPKVLLFSENLQREERKDAIEKQFDQEKKEFRNILGLIDKLEHNQDRLEEKDDLSLLRDKVEYTRQIHDRFARLVIQSISTEMRLKAENPALFWDRMALSFSEHIYQNWIQKEGVYNFAAIDQLLEPLFSPINEFMLPLDWVWEEQEVLSELEKPVEDVDEEEEEDLLRKRVLNWDAIVYAWEPVFDQLLEDGVFTLRELTDLPAYVQERWLSDRETRELWMMFGKEPLRIEVLRNKTFEDEREILIHHLMQKSNRFKVLEGSLIYTDYDPTEKPLRWNGMKITPFSLKLKENA